MHIALASNALWLAAPLIAFIAIPPLTHTATDAAPKVRQAAVAGSFYPADAKELSAMIDGLLAQVSGPPVTDHIFCGGCAARWLSVFRTCSRIHIRGIEGAQVCAGRGDCAVAL